MKTEKWVPCTPELAENPHKVKAWKAGINEKEVRFIAYDKGHERPLIIRFIHGNQSVASCDFDKIECLIEVPIQERFITFYEDDNIAGASHISLETAINIKLDDCTHILKLTFDGENFQVEPVWTKESNS